MERLGSVSFINKKSASIVTISNEKQKFLYYFTMFNDLCFGYLSIELLTGEDNEFIENKRVLSNLISPISNFT